VIFPYVVAFIDSLIATGAFLGVALTKAQNRNVNTTNQLHFPIDPSSVKFSSVS